MIKALVTRSGAALVLLGLSGENMTRLMADEPILLDLADLGLPACEIAIIGGKTQADIIAQLEQHGLVPIGALKPIDERAQ